MIPPGSSRGSPEPLERHLRRQVLACSLRRLRIARGPLHRRIDDEAPPPVGIFQHALYRLLTRLLYPVPHRGA